MEDEPEIDIENSQKETTSKQEELLIEAKSFIDFYKKEMGSSFRNWNNVFFIDFMMLSEFSTPLSDELLINPEEALRLIEIAIEEMGLGTNVRVRLFNLSDSQNVYIRSIRSKHLNELIVIEGIIRQASDVRPQVVNAKFECPSCGTIISVLQIEKKFREPTRCSCGRRGGFKLISKEMVDTQRLIIEEAPDMIVYFDNLQYGCNTSLIGNKTLWSPSTAQGSDDAAHSRQGIFIMKNNKAKGNLGEISYLDIAPTIFNELGLEVPKDMKGKVIRQ